MENTAEGGKNLQVMAAHGEGSVQDFATLLLIGACDEPENHCRDVHDPVVSGLNTSVAFGFLNLILWGGNLWFVFKETGWMAAFRGTYASSQEKAPAPESFGQEGYGQEGYAQQGDAYAGTQGGYQPDYGQGGYTEGGGDYQQGGYQSDVSWSPLQHLVAGECQYICWSNTENTEVID
ncbi:synaptophysin-like [Oncorhynchus nerka]|uniref:synaptophysin-like n=1 Tax=Oncorhynchus nerka TaxID=8023 RepID=UPI0031B86140